MQKSYHSVLSILLVLVLTVTACVGAGWNVSADTSVTPALAQGTIDKGTVYSNVTTRVHTKDFYLISDYTNVTVATGYKAMYHLYDSNCTWLANNGTWVNGSGATSFTTAQMLKTSSKAVYFKLVIAPTGNGNISPSSAANAVSLNSVAAATKIPSLAQGTIDKGTIYSNVTTRVFTRELLLISDYTNVAVASGYKAMYHLYDGNNTWLDNNGAWVNGTGATTFTTAQMMKTSGKAIYFRLVVAPTGSGNLTPDAAKNAVTLTYSDSANIESSGSSSAPSVPSTPGTPSTPTNPGNDLGDMTATASGASGVEKVTSVTAIGATEYVRPTFKTAKDGLNYAYYVPTSTAPSEGRPLILFLHGNGSAGGTFSVDRVLGADNCKWWWGYNFDLIKDAVIIAPHCTSQGNITLGSYWKTSNQAVSLVKKIVSNSTYGKINANRIYLVGFSAGAIATYREIANNGGYFAAAVPIAGAANDSTKNNAHLKKTPIWGWHGKDDPTVKYNNFLLGDATPQIYNTVKSGGLMRFTIVSNGDHYSPLYKAFADRHVWSWLMAQEKGKNQTTNYTINPYLKVVDAQGNTVFSELDTSAASFNTSADQMELTLTDSGRNKLSTAYKASNGQEFSVYFGNKKIATYTATSELSSSVTKFVVKGVFTSANYTEYLNKLQFSISNKMRTSVNDTVNRGFPGGKYTS